MNTDTQTAVEPPLSTETPASHLAPLVAGEWGLWRWFVLRGTGFAIDRVAALCFPQCAYAADRLLMAAQELEKRKQAALQSVHRLLDRLRDESAGPGNARFKSLLNAAGQISAGKAHSVFTGEPECETTIIRWREAARTQAELQAEFDVLFAKSIDQQSREIRKIAADPLFQEAVIWQNRQAFASGLKPLLERTEAACARNKKDRQREELVANYLQRYCLKSETIGFFGPVCWGLFQPDAPVLELLPGKSLLQRRQVYFEDWAISSMAASLSRLPEVRWWTTPGLAPYFQIQDGAAYSARTGPIALDEFALAVARLCNGQTQPCVILERLSATGRFHPLGRPELLAALDSLVAQGILVWGLRTPIEVNAEAGLRSQLHGIGDPVARQKALAALDALESARAAVCAAAGEPARLNTALQGLEAIFEEATKLPAQRNGGATYAARTLVYEDCRRDLFPQASTDLLRPVVPALSLLLRSLRWFVYSSGNAFHKALRQCYRELAADGSGAEIPAAVFAARIGTKLADAPSLREVEQAFHEKWASILSPLTDEHVLQFKSQELQPAVERAFPDLQKGSQPVLYYCPDLMIAATDTEAISRGDALYVLSELHVAKNTLTSALFVEQHPCAAELISATAWDCSPGTFRILPSRKWQRLTVRTNEGIVCAEDYLLASAPDAMAPTGFIAHPISELVVVEKDGRLLLKSRDGSCCFDVLEAFADLFFTFLMHKAAWLRALTHSPRIAIDKLVIQRETWRFHGGALAFALEKQESSRFLGARRWRQQHNLPETMFVKVPLETKPFYVDMNSPIYVEILCKMIRRFEETDTAASTISFSEMLPGPSAAWLPDAGGARYTSEFRLALVDLRARESRASEPGG